MWTRKTLRLLVEARRGVLVPGAFNAHSAGVIADLRISSARSAAATSAARR